MEPCAGAGHLIEHLSKHGLSCLKAFDWEPQAPHIRKANALDLQYAGADLIITNPPWGRDLLHPMIRHFSKLAPTWLLFDADWAYTKQAAPFLKRCANIVAVGRVKWIAGSKNTGMDNCAWYNFVNYEVKTIFHGKDETRPCDLTDDMFDPKHKPGSGKEWTEV